MNSPTDETGSPQEPATARTRAALGKVKRGLLGQRTAAPAPEEPAPAPAPPPAAEGAPPFRRLLKSGIFDVEYYSAAVGRTFPNEQAAAKHAVHWGLPRSVSPSPLLDIVYMPEPVRKAWRAGDVQSIFQHLRSEAGRRAATSVLFDPQRVSGFRAAAEEEFYPGGPLAYFLSVAGDDDPLPVPVEYVGKAPTLGEARSRLIEVVAQFEHQRQLGVAPRLVDEWDEAEEREWKAPWLSAALPPSTDAPLVTIVTPVRNRPGLIKNAIASARRQVLTDWEMVVVDDGSTDDTADVVAELAQQDDRVRLVRQEWSGVCAARNAGIAAARGTYLAFLDSDNEWLPDFLRVAVAAMHHEGFEAAYAGARLDDGKGGTKFRVFDGGIEHLLVKNHVDLNNLVTTTEIARAAGGFDESLRRWVDHDFAIRVARRTSLHFLPFLGCVYDDSRTAPDRITTTESEAWQFAALGKNWVDWAEQNARSAERVTGRASVVIPTYNDSRMTIEAVRALLQGTTEVDLEIVVVDNGSFRETGSQIVSAFMTEPRVTYVRLPRNLNFAIGCNVGFAHSTGSTVVFLNNDTVARPDWLEHLLPHLEHDDVLGVQPLLLYPDDTIQAAGTVFPARNSLPCHFLIGHPREDAAPLGAHRFHAVTAAALAMRADDIARLRGFDPLYVNGMEDVDLCLRAAELRPGGSFVVEPRSVVTHLESKTPGRSAWMLENRRTFMDRWSGRLPASEEDRYERLGLKLAHVSGDSMSVPAPRTVVVRPRAGGIVPGQALRWGIKLPSIPGPLGDKWGDTHLAHSLASSLRALGQDVVTYRHGTHGSSASYLDDVVLGIRGLDVIHPIPGKTNVLWVISHPDDVDPLELQGFDIVFAASETWGAQMAERSGREVQVLHQAVDRSCLPGDDTPVGDGLRPVFVGGTHARRDRKVVRDALTAGVDLVVHGPGWAGQIPDRNLGSEYVPNDELLALYRQHGLVLADHWADMAAEGFIANRLFDAVASGARVISDVVPGVDTVFDGAVQCYETPEDLRALCLPTGRTSFPDDEAMAAIAKRVADEHSFDMRAEQLLAAVIARSTA